MLFLELLETLEIFTVDTASRNDTKIGVLQNRFLLLRFPAGLLHSILAIVTPRLYAKTLFFVVFRIRAGRLYVEFLQCPYQGGKVAYRVQASL